jgi:hypothetical protein
VPPQKRKTYFGKSASRRGGTVDGRPGRDCATVREASEEGHAICRCPRCAVAPLELSFGRKVLCKVFYELLVYPFLLVKIQIATEDDKGSNILRDSESREGDFSL